MRKRVILLALVMALGLTACSILPEDSPIILEGEAIETVESSSHSSKASSEASTTEEDPTEETSEEDPTEETTEEEPEYEWVELPSGGETNPITAREPKDKPQDVDADGNKIPYEKDAQGYDIIPQVMQSYLTGEWKDVDRVNRRNIAVMFPNGYRAGSQDTSPRLQLYGLSKASIIYEAPVEGRITALMGIFEDYDGLDKLGPVANARDYFIYDAMSFDSIYINWGMARIWTEELINSNRIDNISAPTAGIKGGVDEDFFHDEEIIPDAGSSYNGYFDVTKLAETIEAKGYQTEYRDSFEQAFLFADDRIATYDNATSITKIWPGGSGMNGGGYGNFADMNPHFEYDEEQHLYYRYQYGEPMVDGRNGRKIGVTNVVLKICHGEERTPNEVKYDFLAFGIHGTGECYVFTNGKVIKGTWEKSSDPSADYLYDENGNEIVLNQGKTWVCCVWKEYSQYVTME